MNQATQGGAASPQDVQSQTRGGPTAAQQAEGARKPASDQLASAEAALEQARSYDRAGQEAACMDAIRASKTACTLAPPRANSGTPLPRPPIAGLHDIAPGTETITLRSFQVGNEVPMTSRSIRHCAPPRRAMSVPRTTSRRSRYAERKTQARDPNRPATGDRRSSIWNYP